ncbi:Serine hydroxymethyltransferase [Spironucleus salmonicida]|uniref:Serine hydroxymethyltransferase n=1 Tax=Spironucleus salmonicida TaxID=348837 RepID=K7REL4_9EUKA|nr:serine hydroxymethyltransferase [Spironucleus salmonicida]KAH0570020.1 Serine hydroxymethyltransferase [Spironucleus salmonicida]|eukprot:EST42551.1 Serine hydroxymethyltransferase [Spironucleus salmonicida]
MQIQNILSQELARQTNTLNLIASENFPSNAVLSLLSSRIQSKYAEGAPNQRYYQGCENADKIELLCEQQIRKITKTNKEITCQAHAGSGANLAAYNAFLNPGDKILSMTLNAGGHLSHGSSVSMTSKIYNFQHFSNPKNLEQKLAQFRPKMLVLGSSAYPRDVNWEEARILCDQYNVHLHGDVSHNVGLILSDVNHNPFPFCDSVMFTTHKTFRGPRGAILIGDGVKKSVFPGLQGGPFMSNIAGIAQAAIEADSAEFRDKNRRILRFSKEICAKFSTEEIYTGGTDMHYFVLKCAPDVENELRAAGIIVNGQKIGAKNQNGIRIGFPFIVHQGASDAQLEEIGEILYRVVRGEAGALFKSRIIAIMSDITKKLEDAGEI